MPDFWKPRKLNNIRHAAAVSGITSTRQTTPYRLVHGRETTAGAGYRHLITPCRSDAGTFCRGMHLKSHGRHANLATASDIGSQIDNIMQIGDEPALPFSVTSIRYGFAKGGTPDNARAMGTARFHIDDDLAERPNGFSLRENNAKDRSLKRYTLSPRRPPAY